MKREFYAEPMMEVINIDASVICTSAACSDPNMTEEIEIP